MDLITLGTILFFVAASMCIIGVIYVIWCCLVEKDYITLFIYITGLLIILGILFITVGEC